MQSFRKRGQLAHILQPHYLFVFSLTRCSDDQIRFFGVAKGGRRIARQAAG